MALISTLFVYGLGVFIYFWVEHETVKPRSQTAFEILLALVCGSGIFCFGYFTEGL